MERAPQDDLDGKTPDFGHVLNFKGSARAQRKNGFGSAPDVNCNDRFGDMGCNTVGGMLQMRELSASAIAAPAPVRSSVVDPARGERED